MQNKRLFIIVLTIVILLLIPLIAMQFTDEVNWNLFDFVIAGVLLLITGLICCFALRKVHKTKFWILIYIVIFLIFLLIWAELAVGIIGTPFSGN